MIVVSFYSNFLFSVLQWILWNNFWYSKKKCQIYENFTGVNKRWLWLVSRVFIWVNVVVSYLLSCTAVSYIVL